MGGRGASLGAGGAGGSEAGKAKQTRNPGVRGGLGSPLEKVEETRVPNERRRGEYIYNHRQADFYDDQGGIKLSYPQTAEYTGKYGSQKEIQVVTNGYIATSGKNGYWQGINWDNVTKVVGQTYGFQEELKKRGFRWQPDTQAWIK